MTFYHTTRHRAVYYTCIPISEAAGATWTSRKVIVSNSIEQFYRKLLVRTLIIRTRKHLYICFVKVVITKLNLIYTVDFYLVSIWTCQGTKVCCQFVTRCCGFYFVRIFREIQEIEKNDFDFKEEEEPIDYVERVCEMMEVSFQELVQNTIEYP